MADQLVLDIPGVTTTWDRLRAGDRIRWGGRACMYTYAERARGSSGSASYQIEVES